MSYVRDNWADYRPTAEEEAQLTRDIALYEEAQARLREQLESAGLYELWSAVRDAEYAAATADRMFASRRSDPRNEFVHDVHNKVQQSFKFLTDARLMLEAHHS